jgi:hypothetical protein
MKGAFHWRLPPSMQFSQILRENNRAVQRLSPAGLAVRVRALILRSLDRCEIALWNGMNAITYKMAQVRFHSKARQRIPIYRCADGITTKCHFANEGSESQTPKRCRVVGGDASEGVDLNAARGLYSPEWRGTTRNQNTSSAPHVGQFCRREESHTSGSPQ